MRTFPKQNKNENANRITKINGFGDCFGIGADIELSAVLGGPIMFNIGDKVWWVSARGYSLPGGQVGEVYRVDTAKQIACINVEGDSQNPEGYSYPVGF